MGTPLVEDFEMSSQLMYLAVGHIILALAMALGRIGRGSKDHQAITVH